MARKPRRLASAPRPPSPLQPSAQAIVAAVKGLPFQSNGPVWYRGSSVCHPYTESEVAKAALRSLGARRMVVMWFPHFLFLRSVLLRTDLVAMMPSRLVAQDPALKAVAAPIDVPGFEMVMLWHERVHRDPAHRWLRERICAHS